jgi:hypothetical protein
MAAIMIRTHARATWLARLVKVCAKAYQQAQRGMACVAAAILICAVGAALAELAAQLLSISVPAGVAAITVLAAAVLRSLRRARTARTGAGTGPATRRVPGRKPRRISW